MISLSPEQQNGGAEGNRTLASRLCRPQRFLFATAPTPGTVEKQKGPGSESLPGLGSSCGVVLSNGLQRQNVSTHSAAVPEASPTRTTRAGERTNHPRQFRRGGRSRQRNLTCAGRQAEGRLQASDCQPAESPPYVGGSASRYFSAAGVEQDNAIGRLNPPRSTR